MIAVGILHHSPINFLLKQGEGKIFYPHLALKKRIFFKSAKLIYRKC